MMEMEPKKSDTWQERKTPKAEKHRQTEGQLFD